MKKGKYRLRFMLSLLLFDFHWLFLEDIHKNHYVEKQHLFNPILIKYYRVCQ